MSRSTIKKRQNPNYLRLTWGRFVPDDRRMVQPNTADTLYIDDAAAAGPSSRAVFLAYIERAARALPTQRPDAHLDALDSQHDFYSRRLRK